MNPLRWILDRWYDRFADDRIDLTRRGADHLKTSRHFRSLTRSPFAFPPSFPPPVPGSVTKVDLPKSGYLQRLVVYDEGLELDHVPPTGREISFISD